MVTPDLKCQVCDSEPAVGVASSTLGPVSLAYGRNCLANHADAAWLVEATIGLCGGLEHTADWFKEIRVYRDGEYVRVVDAYSAEDSRRIVAEQEAAERELEEPS